MVGPGSSRLLPEDGYPAMPFLHGVRDKARTVLQEEPGKEWHSGGDFGQNRKASLE
jgi:hypothetical protein